VVVVVVVAALSEPKTYVSRFCCSCFQNKLLLSQLTMLSNIVVNVLWCAKLKLMLFICVVAAAVGESVVPVLLVCLLHPVVAMEKPGSLHPWQVGGWIVPSLIANSLLLLLLLLLLLYLLVLIGPTGHYYLLRFLQKAHDALHHILSTEIYPENVYLRLPNMISN
jgi:hypothetical protein